MSKSGQPVPVDLDSDLDGSMVMEGIDGGDLNLSLASIPSIMVIDDDEPAKVEPKRKSVPSRVDPAIGRKPRGKMVGDGVLSREKGHLSSLDEFDESEELNSEVSRESKLEALSGGMAKVKRLKEVESDSVEEPSESEEDPKAYKRKRGGIIKGMIRGVPKASGMSSGPSNKKAKLSVEAALVASGAIQASMYRSHHLRSDKGRLRVSMEERQKIVSVLTSESSSDDDAHNNAIRGGSRERNAFGHGLSNTEKLAINRHLKVISALDPHGMRSVAYRPIRAQEFHEFDLHMANIPWYTDLSQFGLFQKTVLTQWPAHSYQPRFSRFRRSESRFVHSTDPVTEDLIFENSTALGYPYQLKAGTKILYKNSRAKNPVPTHSPWSLPAVQPAVTLDFPFEDDPPPLVRSLLPNQDVCKDFLPERSGMVDETYEGSAILGGNRLQYSTPYMDDEDIQLIEKMESETKRPGFAAPKRIADSIPFESLNKRALPAASQLFHMAPVDSAQDRETVDEHVTLLQSLSHILEDSWQTLLDHHTRVERRKRRQKREKERKEKQTAQLAENGPLDNRSEHIPLLDDGSMAIDLDEHVDASGMKNHEMDVSGTSEFGKQVNRNGRKPHEDENGVISLMDEDEGTMADNEFEGDFSGSLVETHQDITSHVELEPSEYLRQQDGEELDDWVTRLACIIDESFYRYTMPAEGLEAAMDATMDAQEAVFVEEFGGSADVEVVEIDRNLDSDIEVLSDPKEESNGKKGVKPKKKRGRKRRHENVEAAIEDGFGETTIPGVVSRISPGSHNRANWLFAKAKAVVPPTPALERFREEDLAPISPMMPFRVSRPTHELLTSEVSSLLNEVLDGLLLQSAEVYKERYEKKPRIDMIFNITKSHEIVISEMQRVCESTEMRQVFERKCKLLFENYSFQKLWPRGLKDSLTRNQFLVTRPLHPYQLVPRFSRSRAQASQDAPPMEWSTAVDFLKKIQKLTKIVKKAKKSAENAVEFPEPTTQQLELERLQAMAIPIRFIMPPVEQTPDMDRTMLGRKEGDDSIIKAWKRSMSSAHAILRFQYRKRVKEVDQYMAERHKAERKGLPLPEPNAKLLPFLKHLPQPSQPPQPKVHTVVIDDSDTDVPVAKTRTTKKRAKKTIPTSSSAPIDLTDIPDAPPKRKRGRPPKPKP